MNLTRPQVCALYGIVGRDKRPVSLEPQQDGRVIVRRDTALWVLTEAGRVEPWLPVMGHAT